MSKKNILKAILALLISGTLSVLYARYISTRGLVVKEYPIKTTSLDEHYDGLKLLQFSDLHYGSTIGLKELKSIINKINKLNPDVILFTGDLIEKNTILSDEDINKITKELNKLDAKIEILAVKGNHDYDHDYFDIILDKLDWIVLDNTYEYVYKESSTPIVFVGLDDLIEGTPDYNNAFSYINEIKDKELYTIVLSHEPDQIEEIKNYNFNLVISGHSHLGQVRLPFIGAIYTPIGSKKYYDEHYKVGNADLYINGGIGTSTLKLRFLNKPSINLYRFYTK